MVEKEVYGLDGTFRKLVVKPDTPLKSNYQKREIIFSPDRSQIDIRTQTKDGKYVTLHFSWDSPEARFLGTTPSNLADVILIEREFRICSSLVEQEFWRMNKERKRRR